ncbi:MAG: prepilin peptidase [Microbacteriaceae bacterium]
MRALYICAVVFWGIALARKDFAEHRLPDRLTLPAIPAAFAVVAQIWPDRIVHGLEWGVIAVAGATVLALVADLGWGDVKLVASLGTIVGGSDTITEATAAMCLAGGVHVLIHLVIDGNKRAHIPFGPALLVGFGPSLLAAT